MVLFSLRLEDRGALLVNDRLSEFIPAHGGIEHRSSCCSRLHLDMELDGFPGLHCGHGFESNLFAHHRELGGSVGTDIDRPRRVSNRRSSCDGGRYMHSG